MNGLTIALSKGRILDETLPLLAAAGLSPDDDLSMSRNDIADYLGLTIETVCRVLSAMKREGVIAIPTPHRIELRDREALEALCEA